MAASSLHDPTQNISAERIREHIQTLEGVRHPLVAPEALDQAARYIKETLATLEYEMSEHLFYEDGRQYRNIIAMRAGTRFPQERVIVLAHYDTVSASPGADDNASGIALLLELASAFRHAQVKRTVCFVAVNLEEEKVEGDHTSPWLRGSRALAAHAKQNNWQIAGVIDLEMVAFAGDEVPQYHPEGVPIQVPVVGNFIGIIGNQRSAEIVEHFASSIQRHQIPLPYVPLVVPGNGEILPDVRRSDHAPFWDNGYKAVMITDTAEYRNPNYHKESDTLDTLNLPFAANVCRATAGLVLALANEDTGRNDEG